VGEYRALPKFSLVIPTLQRADTFRYSVATLLAQTYDDFEIVIQNNGRDPETEAIVRDLQDPRVRHFSSETILPMTENWELALSNTRGEFITFLGDDDGLFRDACQLANELINRLEIEIVSWHPCCYFWPNYIHREKRNRLIATITYDLNAQIISSEIQLRRYYRFAIDYSRLPMIYNSFVRRTVIDRVRKQASCYFLGFAPDVTSGIVNAAHTSQFALMSRPLSMTGLSGHSTGHTAFLSARDASNSKIDQMLASYEFDERLIPANNLQVFLANEMLLVRDKVLAGDDVPFDFRGLLSFVAAAINDRPGFYDETLETIKTLAKRHKIDLAEIAIPVRATTTTTPQTGTRMIGPRCLRSVIDGDNVGLHNIADAIRLMEQFLPRREDFDGIGVRAATLDGRASVRMGEIIKFCVGDNGAAALDDGWGEPEQWGTWSISKRASLRLSIESLPGRTLHAELKYRAFVHTLHRELEIVCRGAGRDIASWRCRFNDTSGIQWLTLPSAAISRNGELDIEFHFSDPRSPAELGISPDTRQLGLGIESLRFIKKSRLLGDL
jgi:glycosyltransferase involved in cell wall biosynthesis